MQFARSPVAVPEGDAPTRDRVAQTILENGPTTAADLARLLDLTPAAVRRHLDHLVEEGTVEAREQRVYGTRGRGRPARVFALTESGRDGFDHQYDDLAVDALRFLAETQGEDAVVAFARRRVAFIETRLRRGQRGRARPDARRGAGRGAHPGRLRRRRSARSRSASSSASTTARWPTWPHEFPQLCEAETEVIGRVLGRHVQRLATIAHGDGVCTTCIPNTDLNHTLTTKDGDPA